MKQNISAEDWGYFERTNQEATKKLRNYYSDWQMKNQQENYPNQFITIQYEPIFFWLTIGRMIEFLDENKYQITIKREKDQWLLARGKDNNVDVNGTTLCDALWEAVKKVLNDYSSYNDL